VKFYFGIGIFLLLLTPGARSSVCSRIVDEGSRIAHDAITHDLYFGEIQDVRGFSENDNKQQLYLATVRGFDPLTGQARYRDAFIKPRVWGDGDGFARTPMAYVAYFTNRLLEMDYIPPTAYRKGLSIQMDHETFHEGAVIYRVPGFQTVAALPFERFPADNEAILSDSRVISVLLQNQDAHIKNMGIGQHWVDGSIQPVFIDFDASMRNGTNVSMTDYPAWGNSQPVTKIRRKTFLALKKMSKADLQPLVDANFISENERYQMVAIGGGIVAYFQNLIDKAVARGGSVDEVFIER
jgi:hypothetical protein